MEQEATPEPAIKLGIKLYAAGLLYLPTGKLIVLSPKAVYDQTRQKIHGITVEQVREQLAEETDPKAIKRLTVAREYLDGLSPAEIETKYSWHEQTVYGWLNRFEERGFEAALYDDKPPGQEPELADGQFEEFAETLQEPPEQAGYDEPAWTSKLARQHLIEEYDIAYSLRHV